MSGEFQVLSKVDDRDVRRGLLGLKRRGKNMRSVFVRLKKPFRDDIRGFQKRRMGPDGAWAPRAASTKERDKGAKTVGGKKGGKKGKRFRRRRKRDLLGVLPKAVSIKTLNKGFRAEAKVPWASVHHDGGTVGNGAVLPARPFLFFSESFLDLAEREIGNSLELGWKR